MDYREGNPALTRGLDNATSILSLICLVAMVLGAIGVAMAMHAHLEQRMDMLAILKAMGADSSDLLRIFLLQTLGLGLAGGLLGVAAGVAVMAALPAAFGQLLPGACDSAISLAVGAGGIGNGPADDSAVLLAAVARRARRAAGAGVAQDGGAGTAGDRGLVCAMVGAAIATRHCGGGDCGLGGIAWALSDSPKVGAWFASSVHRRAGGPAGSGCRHALVALRFLLNRTRLHLPSSLRHGLANLYRPGNQSAAVLAALGTGVMLILAVYLMQKDLLRDLRETASPKLPNVFLVDVRSEEVDGVKAFFAHQAGREPAARV